MSRPIATDVRRPMVSEVSPLARLLLVPLVIAAFIDLPRLIQLGPLTMQGALAVGQVILGLAGLLLAFRYPRPVLTIFIPYALFLGWMLGRTSFASFGQAAFQNGTTYVLFGVEFLLAATLAAANPRATSRIIRSGFVVIDVVGLGLVAASLLLAGVPTSLEGEGAWLVGPRSLGLVGIVAVGWHAAGWFHGRPAAGARMILWAAAVLLSMSRMALLVAVFIIGVTFALQVLRAPRGVLSRMPALVAGSALLVLLVLWQSSTFYSRYFEGYTTVAIGGVDISTSGRTEFWPTVIASAMQHPIIGGGLGSSQAAVAEYDSETVGHPHNDYLRVWHDGGVIGLGLLLVAFAYWLRTMSAQWSHAVTAGSADPDIDLAGVLTLIGLMLSCITDNTVVYAFMMGPIGLLIGAACGIRASTKYRAVTVPVATDQRLYSALRAGV